MYLAVDVGGTKVLMAAFNNKGELIRSLKFPTPQNYYDFLSRFVEHREQLDLPEIKAAAVAIPGRIDRKLGVGIAFGNLNWKNVPIQHDLAKLLHCPVVIENDAKAGGLAEAIRLKDKYSKVLYLAIGTGIGLAYMADGVIDTNFGDRGGNRMNIEVNGKLVGWEQQSSGKAIVRRFGQKASEITDPKIWKVLSHEYALGIVGLLATLETDVVVVGGGVGSHFPRFKSFLKADLAELVSGDLKVPALVQAAHTEEAVVYGCYYLAKETNEYSR